MEDKIERVKCMSECLCIHRNKSRRIINSYISLNCCFFKMLKNFAKERGRDYKLKKRIEELSYFLLENDEYENENIYIQRSNYLKDVIEVVNFLYKWTVKNQSLYSFNIDKTFLMDYF